MSCPSVLCYWLLKCNLVLQKANILYWLQAVYLKYDKNTKPPCIQSWSRYKTKSSYNVNNQCCKSSWLGEKLKIHSLRFTLVGFEYVVWSYVVKSGLNMKQYLNEVLIFYIICKSITSRVFLAAANLTIGKVISFLPLYSVHVKCKVN